jgi:hypothetical protein
MDTIKPFSATENLARVTAGMRASGPFLKNPVTVPARTIVEGYPAEVAEKFSDTGVKKATPIDPWNVRRNK